MDLSKSNPPAPASNRGRSSDPAPTLADDVWVVVNQELRRRLDAPTSTGGIITRHSETKMDAPRLLGPPTLGLGDSDTTPPDGDPVPAKTLASVLRAFAAARANGVKIARLPTLVANIEKTHTFRYAWSVATGSTSLSFTSNHIASPLAYATTTTAARCLMVSGRLRAVKLIWVDYISGSGEYPSILTPPELVWYPAPGSSIFSKREVIVGSPSTSAGGGILTATPPKNSWQSMWQSPTSGTNNSFMEIDMGTLTQTRAFIIDLTIDCVFVAGVGATNAVPSLTVSTGIADKVVQLVPLVNGSAAGDAQGYYTASY